MDSRQKKYFIIILSLIAAMMALLFVTVFLTHGKELSEFTPRDSTILTVFIFCEVLLFAVMMGVAIRAGRYNTAVGAAPVKTERTAQEKAYYRHGVWMLVFSVLLALALEIAGILIYKKYPAIVFPKIQGVFFFCLLLPFLCIPINFLLNRLYLNSVKGRQVAEIQKYIFTQREFAETTSVHKLAHLRTLRSLMTASAVVHFVLGSIVAFYTGVLFPVGESEGSFFFFYAAIFIYFNVFSRIPFKSPDAIFTEDRTYVSEADYPVIYSAARRAADKIGTHGDVRISLGADCNAGITMIGNVYSVQIGVTLLACFTEEELYNILLHEFAHMAETNQDAVEEFRFYLWLTQEKPKTFLSSLSSLIISHIDVVYSVQYELYRFASSVLKEQLADRAMADYGTPEIAASALLKLNYHNLYEWEKGTYDLPTPLFASETPSNRYITDDVECFLNVISLKKDDWNKLTDVEILARSATHPTTKLRFMMLGVSEYKLCEDDRSEAFKSEQKRALQYIEDLISSDIGDSYDEIRREEYAEPLEIVETWEALGRPIVAEEYADVVQALRKIGRNREAIALCKRATKELPSFAAAFAYFLLGCHLLHCYEQEGVGYIYKAMELNQNYIDEGLDVIGTFCCLTGRQDELDAYREEAIRLVQKQVDEYDEAGLLNKKDNLSPETGLPRELYDSILQFIFSIDSGVIDAVWLFRKTVSDEFFTSVFVVKYKDGVPAGTRDDIQHKIFRYLDTCDDWQFSLFEFSEVSKVKFEQIEGSLVYNRKD